MKIRSTALIVACTCLLTLSLKSEAKDSHPGHEHSEVKDHKKHDDHKHANEDPSAKESHDSHKHDSDDHADHKESHDSHKHDSDDHADHAEHKNDKKTDSHDGHNHAPSKNKKLHNDEKHDDHSDHGDEHSEIENPNKALSAVKADGAFFKLSSVSANFLGLKFSTPLWNSDGSLKSGEQALIRYQNQYGIYVKQSDGWIRLAKAKASKMADGSLRVTSQDITDTDQILTTGTGFVRAAHLEASGQGGQGHAH